MDEEGRALDDLFEKDRVDVNALAQRLDRLSDTDRAASVGSLTGRQQAMLFESAKGFRAIALDHFVPAAVPPLAQVVHSGTNSLPVFSRFQKRFCLPQAGAKCVCGYNRNPPLIQPFTGPGYFVGRA